MQRSIGIAVIIFIESVCGCAQSKRDNIKTGQAGFRTIQAVDRSRLYRPDGDSTNYLHYRPVDIDIWYPAAVSKKDTALAFRDLLCLLEKRANYYTASNTATGITPQIAQSLCEGFKCSDSSRLLAFKTRSFPDATPLTGRFPLIIYLCSYNGMGYENYRLFEQLAESGFVVLSVSSIGRFPGEMTMKYGDLMEQVNDALFSFGLVSRQENIDRSQIGIIGYSWGGLAAALLTGKIPAVHCLVSLEGSEFHHYGAEQDENADFEGIRKSADFQKLSLAVPYLRLESGPAAHPEKQDSLYDFSEKLSGSKQTLQVDSAEHQDFSCLPGLIRESGGCTDEPVYGLVLRLTAGFLNDQFHSTHSFPHLAAGEMNRTIREIKSVSTVK